MYEKTVTDSGLRILTSHMPHTKSVSIAFYVGAGSRYETPEEAGVSHFVEHLCFKGTRRRPTAREISEAIEGIGGILNAATDRELTTYWCKVPLTHFGLAVDILSDMLREPLFDAVEVDKERQVILEELSMSNDIPSYRADLLIDEVMWPDQPLGRDVGGTRETVSNITRDMLLEYMQRQYTLPNLVVSVAGNITHQEVADLLTLQFQGWTSHQPGSWFPVEEGQSAPRMKLESRKTEQARICTAVKGLSATHPDRYALDLLNTVLGGGMSSRLFLELRENQGLVYDVHTTSSHLRDCGSFTTYAGVDPKNARKAVHSILQELHRIKDGIPEDELHRAREFLKGRLVIRMEDSQSVAAWMGAQELLHNRVFTVDQTLAHVDTITPEDLQRVARSLLVTEKLSMVIVGPYRSDKAFQARLKI
ncbi:MAG: insulinase family protein [Dehalococcoidia bacterium]|nr:insulinase family protein [Dehalococcoidia bacterium]